MPERKEGKLSYEELVNILCVLALDVKDIRDQVNVMWNELVHHSGDMNLKGNWYGLDKRLRMVEEELDGFRIHYTDTLKEIKTKTSPPLYNYISIKEEDNSPSESEAKSV